VKRRLASGCALAGLLLSAVSLAVPELEGRISLELPALRVETVVHHDRDSIADQVTSRYDRLPEFAFDYVQAGDRLLPATPVPPAHGSANWEYRLGVGRVLERGAGESLEIQLPVSLLERNQNCIHNGMLHLSFAPSANRAAAVFAVASETCRYFQFDLRLESTARLQRYPVPGRKALLEQFEKQRAARLPIDDFQGLQRDHPAFDIAALANTAAISPEHMTLYGLVLDGRHYRGPCNTRQGGYPLCDELLLPSYSVAKSLFAGLALMRLETLYPGAATASIADLVAGCSQSEWGKVRLVDALDMVTGRYGSREHGVDEGSDVTLQGFFLAQSHGAKLRYACSAWPRQAAPGEAWVYHSTDTYLLGAAMTALLRNQRGDGADIFNDLVLPLWEPLALSAVSRHTLRSDDAARQPIVGYGLAFQPDDLVRLALALAGGYFEDVLDPAMLATALQGGAAPNGHPALGNLYYAHGFYALNLEDHLDCSAPRWVPFMSGYGGIGVILLGTDDLYYYVSDGGNFGWREPLRAIHRASPLC